MEISNILEYKILGISIISIEYLTYKLNILSKREIIKEQNKEILNKINNKLENMINCIFYTIDNITITKKVGEATNNTLIGFISKYDSIPTKVQKNLKEIGNSTKKTLDTLADTLKPKEILKGVEVNNLKIPNITTVTK